MSWNWVVLILGSMYWVLGFYAISTIAKKWGVEE